MGGRHEALHAGRAGRGRVGAEDLDGGANWALDELGHVGEVRHVALGRLLRVALGALKHTAGIVARRAALLEPRLHGALLHLARRATELQLWLIVARLLFAEFVDNGLGFIIDTAVSPAAAELGSHHPRLDFVGKVAESKLLLCRTDLLIRFSLPFLSPPTPRTDYSDIPTAVFSGPPHREAGPARADWIGHWQQATGTVTLTASRSQCVIPAPEPIAGRGRNAAGGAT